MFIYAISRGDDGPVKIGISYNPGARCRDLQTSNGDRLKLIDMWRVDRVLARLQESQIHRELENKRMCGEWFDITEADIRVFLEGFFASRRAERIILSNPVII